MPVNTADMAPSLHLLLAELIRGAPEDGAFVLNPRDPGMLNSLDRLTAQAASVPATGGASIAAHVNHVRYALSLMNRWAAGEDAFDGSDWAASWQTSVVTDQEWTLLRQQLRREAEQWMEAVVPPREVLPPELTGMIASIAHLAYHLGAMRQIDRSLRGPAATDQGDPSRDDAGVV